MLSKLSTAGLFLALSTHQVEAELATTNSEYMAAGDNFFKLNLDGTDTLHFDVLVESS